MPLARRLVTSLCLVLLWTTLLSSSISLAEGELPGERGAERERAAASRRSATAGDDAPSLFLPLSSVPSSSALFRGSTLRRHASHRVYSPLWLHDGTFYALDERGSFPGDASAHVAGAATRVEALPTASAAALVGASFRPPSPCLRAPALLLEVPWPAHVDSTAVWMEIVAGAAAAVREAMEAERAEMAQQRQRQRLGQRRRRPPPLDLVVARLFSRASSAPLPPGPPPPVSSFFFFLDDDRSQAPLHLVILLPNLDAKTWLSSPGARWAREEALPLALEAAAEVALGSAAAADGSSGREKQQRERRPLFFSLSYLTRSDLGELCSSSPSERGADPASSSSSCFPSSSSWVGFEAVLVPHGRVSTPRRDAGFGAAAGGGGGGGGGSAAAERPDALAVAFRRRAWEAAGLPLGALDPSSPPRVERGCDPRAAEARGGESGGGGGRRGGGPRDIVLVSEPSSSSARGGSSSSSSNSNALDNFDELSEALERAALSLGLGARPALLTPSTPLAAAARVAARALVVVGRAGPALAGLVPLLAPGSGVVELVPPNWEWDGSHLLVRNLTRALFAGGGGSKPGSGARGRGNGRGVLYSSWRPGELPAAPAAPRSLVYSTREDEERFGRWSSPECAGDRECTEATARGSLRVDVAAVVDEVVLLAAPLLSCDNAVGLDGSGSGESRDGER